jgi:dTDP-4-dehydrorhamnose 3,5-epimerase
MKIERTTLAGMLVIVPERFEDFRGYFAPVFRHHVLEAEDVAHGWVQENQSLSRRKGTVRGLHFQRSPFAQAKLVRVVRGAALDVCVDLRRGSPTFGRHEAVELTAENLKQAYIPEGFAHGFCTLTDDTEVLYKVSERWSPEHEGGLIWSDPALGIDWPVKADEAILSDRDRCWPQLLQLGADH